MGKKRVSTLGSEDEAAARSKRAVQLEQKKLREGPPAGKRAKSPGLAGGQRVVDTTAESLAELAVIEAKKQALATSTPEAQAKTPKKIRTRSKAYQAAKAQVNPESAYPLDVALSLLKKVSITKFDPTVELHLTLKEKGFTKNIDLPHSTGKTRKAAVADAATLAQIAAGRIDFDLLYASADQMGQLIKYAKVLGPKGLMPNPKAGTVVSDPAAAVADLASKNTITLKTEKDAPLIHTQIGKLSLGDAKLTANIQAVLAAVPRPQKVVLKSTMSPAIKLVV